MSVAVETVGADTLAAAFRKLAGDGVRSRVLRPALTSALNVMRNAMKGRVPAKFKGARNAFGTKVKADKKAGGLTGKVGVAVGFTKKKAEKKALTKRSKAGIGISAANLHWFILGTAERFTGAKTRRDRKSGTIRSTPTGKPKRFRGLIDPQKFAVANLVREATAASQSEALDTFNRRVAEGLAKEAAKSMEQQAREAAREAAGKAKRAANAAAFRAGRKP